MKEDLDRRAFGARDRRLCSRHYIGWKSRRRRGDPADWPRITVTIRAGVTAR